MAEDKRKQLVKTIRLNEVVKNSIRWWRRT